MDIVKSADAFIKGARGLETAFGNDVKAACKLPTDKLAEQIEKLAAYRAKVLEKDGKSWGYICIGRALGLMRKAAKGDMPVFEGKSLREWHEFNQPTRVEKDAAPRNPLAKFEGSPKQLAAFVLEHFEGNPKGLAAFRKALSAE